MKKEEICVVDFIPSISKKNLMLIRETLASQSKEEPEERMDDTKKILDSIDSTLKTISYGE